MSQGWQHWRRRRRQVQVLTMLVVVAATLPLTVLPTSTGQATTRTKTTSTTTIVSGLVDHHHPIRWSKGRIGSSRGSNNNIIINNNSDHDSDNHRRYRRRLQKRIVGGKPVTVTADPDQHQFAAAFAFSAGRKLCGATVIHPDVLLSAAHCAGAFVKDGVLIGGVDLSGVDATEFVGVASEQPHPHYHKGSEQNDIMLVKLDRSSEAPLVKYNVNASIPRPSSALTVVGFGHTSTNGTNAPTLQQVEVGLVSNEDCKATLLAQDLVVDPVTMLCSATTSTENTTAGSCDGDSGGPVFDVLSGVQVGIVSWGNGICGDPNSHDINVRVSAYANWIFSSLCCLSDVPPADCSADIICGPTMAPSRSPSVMNTSNGTGPEMNQTSSPSLQPARITNTSANIFGPHATTDTSVPSSSTGTTSNDTSATTGTSVPVSQPGTTFNDANATTTSVESSTQPGSTSNVSATNGVNVTTGGTNAPSPQPDSAVNVSAIGDANTTTGTSVPASQPDSANANATTGTSAPSSQPGSISNDANAATGMSVPSSQPGSISNVADPTSNTGGPSSQPGSISTSTNATTGTATPDTSGPSSQTGSSANTTTGTPSSQPVSTSNVFTTNTTNATATSQPGSTSNIFATNATNATTVPSPQQPHASPSHRPSPSATTTQPDSPSSADGASSPRPIVPSSPHAPMVTPVHAPGMVAPISSASSLPPFAPPSPAPMPKPVTAPVVAFPSASGTRPVFETLLMYAQKKQSTATSTADNDSPCDVVLHTCTLQDKAPGVKVHRTFMGFCFERCQPAGLAHLSLNDFGYKCGPCTKNQ